MTIFAVTYRYSDDIVTRDALRTEHRDYLRGLSDQGLLLVSGPFGPTEPAGALLLFRADDKAHVDALVEKDPFTPSGVIAEKRCVMAGTRGSSSVMPVMMKPGASMLARTPYCPISTASPLTIAASAPLAAA